MKDYDFKTNEILFVENAYEPFVYIIKEVETGRSYIGSKTQKGCLTSDLGSKYFTSSNEIKDKWKSDLYAFEVVEIIKCHSNHQALILEGLMIEENNAVYDDSFINKGYPSIGFNNSGKELSDRAKKNMSESRKGRVITEEWRRNLSIAFSGEKNPNYGKRLPDWHKQILSDLRKGKILSQETKNKISNSLKDRFFSEDHRRKISESTKGKPKSEQTKKKLSEVAKRRKKVVCEHCGKSVDTSNYGRWHGGRCTDKEVLNESTS